MRISGLQSGAMVGERETAHGQFRRACAAARAGNVELAHAIVAQAEPDAWILNLMGVLALKQSDWKTARKCWRRALRAQRNYAPARRNLRRYYELYALGYSCDPVALGDEPEFAWGSNDTADSSGSMLERKQKVL